MAKAMTTEERLQALAEYDPKEHLIKIKARDGAMKDYLPAAWRFYELSLRYPNANFSIDLILTDQEKNFCVVRARLYLGASYEQSDKKAESMKQGQMSALDKAETAAKARCSRDFGIGTEYALEFSDEDVDEVPSQPRNETSAKSTSSPSENFVPKFTSSSKPQQQQQGTQTQPVPLATKKTVTPAVPIQVEPRKEKMITSQQIEEIATRYDLFGHHEWNHLLEMKKLGEDTAKWTTEQAFSFLTFTLEWEGSDQQKAWLKQKALDGQQEDIKKFRREYGDTAVVALKSRIAGVKDTKSTDFTRGQADTLLGYLYTAQSTIALARVADPDFAIAKSFAGMTHPLDFYGSTDGDLEGYLKKLEETQAKIAA